ncbi:MAG: molybdenum cofactor guanylyltransferase [Pirellulaceae bacterium]
MVVGGMILCGGASRRMGQSKATLPFGTETMLARVLRLLGEVVEPRLVVAAPSQELPALPAAVRIVRDRTTGRGPLEGLYCGLSALGTQVDAAYVSGCDVPLLRPQFIRRMIELLGEHDVVVPVEGQFHHPLAAVYRTRIVDTLASLLARDELRMNGFYSQVSTRYVEVDTLRDVDPDLESLLNTNRLEDYARALRQAGLQ